MFQFLDLFYLLYIARLFQSTCFGFIMEPVS